jgi:hypothetical protein
MEVEERPRAPGEVTGLALSQLGKPAQLREQCLQAIKVVLRGVPHGPSMTSDVTAAQAPGPGRPATASAAWAPAGRGRHLSRLSAAGSDECGPGRRSTLATGITE